jgi:hypothetical protein
MTATELRQGGEDATLADAVRRFLAVSDQQADEGRAIAAKAEVSEGGLEILSGYLADWQPRIEANWSMLRAALDEFDARQSGRQDGASDA